MQLLTRHGEEPQFTSEEVPATMQPSAEHDAGANPRPDRDEDVIVQPTGGAEPALTDGRGICVVLDDDGYAARFAQELRDRDVIPPRHVRDRRHCASRGIDGAR